MFLFGFVHTFATSNKKNDTHNLHTTLRTQGKRINTATYTMKNLNDMVKDILNAKSSKAAKKRAILELGLTNYEAELLTACTENVSRRKSYTFGVEIEMLVPSYAVIERAEANSLPIRYENYNHNTKRYFKFISDGSICGENPIECVSPVLNSRDGFKTLELACKTINEAGAVVNRSTGLHVHIGAADLTEEAYSNVFQNYKMLELLIDSFMSRSRRLNNNRYCQSLKDCNFDGLTRTNVLDAVHHCRYYKVNACSYSNYKTIEFRQHQGTTSYEKISHWVKFCAKLVEWSKTHRLTEIVASVDGIEFLNKEEKKFFKNRQIELAIQ